MNMSTNDKDILKEIIKRAYIEGLRAGTIGVRDMYTNTAKGTAYIASNVNILVDEIIEKIKIAESESAEISQIVAITKLAIAQDSYWRLLGIASNTEIREIYHHAYNIISDTLQAIKDSLKEGN